MLDFKTSILLTATVVISLCDGQVPTSYACLEGKEPQDIVASQAIKLHLKHPLYRYLHPNQRCEMRIRFQDGINSSKKHRWLVSVVDASLKAYSASVEFVNSVDASPADADRLKPPLTYETPNLEDYQFITVGDSFSVVFSTKMLPEWSSTGVVLLAQPFHRCPAGWFDTGISCYGLPYRPSTALTSHAASEAACGFLGGGQLSQGLYINDHIGESIESLLSFRFGKNESLLRYWVGIVSAAGDGRNFTYTNGYRTPHIVEPGQNCAPKSSAGVCNCVVYSSGKFLAENCQASHRYICSMPLASASWPRPDSSCVAMDLVSPAWRSVSIAFIVQAVLLFLIIIIWCCCRCRR